MNKTLTVIIPVYNKQRYLRRLFDCLAKQHFTDFECLLIDDGSTDGSGTLCDEAAASDKRLVVFHIPNGGVSHARNVGLSAAKGKYITFVDSDDELHPAYLQNLVACIEQSNADLVIGGFSRIWDDKADVEPVAPPYASGVYTMETLLPDFAITQRKYGTYGWCWAKILPRAVIGDTRFTEGLALAEDFDFYLKLYPKIKTVCFDDKPYYSYRQAAENSAMFSKNDYATDYFAQLQLNLRYRDFLKRMQGFDGENERVINTLLSNYSFFTLFYSEMSCFDEKFCAVRDCWKRESYPLQGFSRLSNRMLFYLQKNKRRSAKRLLYLYRSLRRIMKRGG